MVAPRIAVIDDDKDILLLTAEVLSSAGHRPEAYSDAEVALAAMRASPPALVLLDVHLGATTGMDVCRRIRTDPALALLPVILVTGAAVEVADQVLGFAVGADDYVLKPWTPSLLLARVGAVLRRSSEIATQAPLVYGPLTLDPARREAHVEGAPLVLTPTEFRILLRLVSRPERAWTRSELLEEGLEGEEVRRAGRHVDVHVLAIRNKLGVWRELVQTAYRVGYRAAPLASLAPRPLPLVLPAEVAPAAARRA